MGDSTNLSPHIVKALPAFFFLTSIGYKVVWTAISSLIKEYSDVYGPEVLLYLNIAYFFPSIPVLIIQAYTIDIMDRRLGAPQGTMVRFGVGMGGLAVLCLTFRSMGSLSYVLVNTVLVGICYGVAFGTSYQVVAKFPPENTVSLTTGFVSVGVVVFIFDLIIKAGPHYTAAELQRLFLYCSLTVLAGLAAAYTIVFASWKKLALSTPMKPGGGLPSSHKPTLPGTANKYQMINGSSHSHDAESRVIDVESRELDGKSEDECAKQKASATMHSVFLRIWAVATALFLSVGTSMLFFPFFSYMQSSGLLGEHLHQVLFYIRLLGDICGRIVPTSWQSRNQQWLLTLSVVKSLMLPPLFLGVWMPALLFGDLGVVVLVAVFWSLSGYINTCAYLAAPLLVPPHQAGKVGSMMATIFQVACFTGLMVAYGLQLLWHTATPSPLSPLSSPIVTSADLSDY